MTKNCVQCLFQGKVTETYPIPQYFPFLKYVSTYTLVIKHIYNMYIMHDFTVLSYNISFK